MEDLFLASLVARPRSLASSQTSNFGHDMRHAAITSSYVLSRVASHSTRSTTRFSRTESAMSIFRHTTARTGLMSYAASEERSLQVSFPASDCARVTMALTICFASLPTPVRVADVIE